MYKIRPYQFLLSKDEQFSSTKKRKNYLKNTSLKNNSIGKINILKKQHHENTIKMGKIFIGK